MSSILSFYSENLRVNASLFLALPILPPFCHQVLNLLWLCFSSFTTSPSMPSGLPTFVLCKIHFLHTNWHLNSKLWTPFYCSPTSNHLVISQNPYASLQYLELSLLCLQSHPTLAFACKTQHLNPEDVCSPLALWKVCLWFAFWSPFLSAVNSHLAWHLFCNT